MRKRYLRPSYDLPEIYLYRTPIDFRKQANGLALLVEQELGHSPFSGALYAFT
ncbi:transposase [Ectothiorhodospira haloalkaliphila]|uniref:Transposase n=2 Tax=Ectothiorhodospira TaxID=1051 RepID=W8L8B5_9GAMM|nr:IS66 family insertion sequence element accessory protein TnpB [Ectothiorhodospira haloalkaliphila]AHK80075.1 transposase [Ectothiorhodospira haloalkaliphila]